MDAQRFAIVIKVNDLNNCRFFYRELLELGEPVVDSTYAGQTRFTGRIGWIADKAEFTPKVIQTRNERANLVYALKIYVANPGLLKIGMPAEVYFNRQEQ